VTIARAAVGLVPGDIHAVAGDRNRGAAFTGTASRDTAEEEPDRRPGIGIQRIDNVADNASSPLERSGDCGLSVIR